MNVFPFQFSPVAPYLVTSLHFLISIVALLLSLQAHEVVARLQDGDSETLAQAESQLPFSRDVDVTSTAMPRVEGKELSC